MDELISEVLWTSEDGCDSLRVDVSEFRDNMYLSIRYWYLDMDEVWQPTSKGITIPYNVDNVTRLAQALTLLLSDKEKEILLSIEKADQK